MHEDRHDRCVICGARDWRSTARTARYAPRDWRECSHCGLLARADMLTADRLRDFVDMQWSEARSRDGRFRIAPSDPVFMEAYTFRSLALGRRHYVLPPDRSPQDELTKPYGATPADACVEPIEGIAPVPVSLAMLTRSCELPGVLDRARGLTHEFGDIVLVVDGEGLENPRDTSDAGIRIVHRPLAGDFSGQRNAAQATARHEWVLQLDADESVNQATLSDLGRVAALAQRDGALSVGLVRFNHVGGVLSDLYPDIQYRLNRRGVRYHGRVHERPHLPNGWSQSFIAPNLAIDHHLDAAHVAARSAIYDTMAPGEGRTFERGTLSTPFRR
ncbi:glycosyltransferase [Fulvimarina sp. 2208YS6-2-32]|uniref:Glycosyltransferase n=1 Tax=Fulvimarina uroteuthidis TaxID=3098149 RepID=A0ABU5HZ36_9HYPH|nr:glycosyltransferase [Fulvimarina sp. 2208YS6-2-32]MDY8108147.1 glycosyltransferase [Fulvimarina sp. 2208YS6-2-32]